MTFATTILGSTALVTAPQAQLGRPFQPKGEALLIPQALEAALRRGSRAARLVVIPEFRGPYGVADLAVLSTTDGAIAERLALDLDPLVNQLDAAIVGTLAPRRTLRISTLARELEWPERHLTPRIAALVRRGAVTQSRSGALARHAALEPLGDLSVYEAKTTDWRRGLDQAATYATWANFSLPRGWEVAP